MLDDRGKGVVLLHAGYFDAGKTVAQGRKVPRDAASPYVILKDIADVLQALRVPWEQQFKAYCRDALWQRDRLRVRLRGEDGSPFNPDVPDRRALMAAVASGLRTHPERCRRKLAPPGMAPSGCPFAQPEAPPQAAAAGGAQAALPAPGAGA